MNKFTVKDCWESEVPEEKPCPSTTSSVAKPKCTGMKFISYKVKEMIIRILAIIYGCGTTYVTFT